ncbi:MAG: UDP-N-acetylmuramoyl-L-alanyl-D-glutamate--2,6-diaminopimelate ligase [Clostridia bacterium]|nr:UDP-N-acetylmuramoyl-L-alanyl-D-glutamate--2,6-diaminopimelate ligase [Clostridia bacterium]
MRFGELIKNTSILGSNTEITSICYDSRKVTKGSLFVAIRGYQTDGHQYIQTAVQNGAAAIVAEENVECGVPLAVFPDTRKALAEIAARFYGNPADKLTLIGITGTNGKTTTTYLIKQVLDLLGIKTGLIGTNQNIIGDKVLPAKRTTPESLEMHEMFAEMVAAGVTHVVMEVSSHSLVLSRTYGIVFKEAVFTNLTRDHLDFHKTMDAYMESKAMLFTSAMHGAINADDAYCEGIEKAATCPVLRYGVTADCDLKAQNIRLSERGVIFTVNYKGKDYELRLGIPGMFSVYNALAATAACLGMGIPMEDIVKGLLLAKGVKGRAEVVQVIAPYTVIIDYAHTPDGLENIIGTIRGFVKGRIITLFGCGGDRDKTKRPIMGRVACELSDYCIVTSDNPRSEDPDSIIQDILEGMSAYKDRYTVVTNRREAIQKALSIAKEGDVVILSGKGHETYQILKDKTIDFDERTIVKEILKNAGA